MMNPPPLRSNRMMTVTSKKSFRRRTPAQVERILHDRLCQTLTGLSFRATALAQKTAKVDPALGRELRELYCLIERARRECREVLTALRKPLRAPVKGSPRGVKARSA